MEEVSAPYLVKEISAPYLIAAVNDLYLVEGSVLPIRWRRPVLPTSGRE
jgi:hypothetical protein